MPVLNWFSKSKKTRSINCRRRELTYTPLEPRLALSSMVLTAPTKPIGNATRIANITVSGQSILGSGASTGGVYLIGSVDGSDNSGRSVTSIGGFNGKMRPDSNNVPSPTFSMTFTPNGAGRMKFSANIGPVPADFVTMSLPFDFSKSLTESFRFNGTSYRVECSTVNGVRQGSGATFDSVVPHCVIPNTGGKKVAVAVVNGAVSWGEVKGSLATVRVTVDASSHYSSLRFHNHFGTDNLELSFGRMRKGESAFVRGEIVVTPNAKSAPVVFQVEANAFLHQIGRHERGSNPNEAGWSVRVGDTANRYMAYGPYTQAVASGSRAATFRLQLDNVTADNNRILTIDVYDATTGKVLAKREIKRKDFSKALTYQDFNLNFNAVSGNKLEFRTFWHGGSYAKLNKVTVK